VYWKGFEPYNTVICKNMIIVTLKMAWNACYEGGSWTAVSHVSIILPSVLPLPIRVCPVEPSPPR